MAEAALAEEDKTSKGGDRMKKRVRFIAIFALIALLALPLSLVASASSVDGRPGFDKRISDKYDHLTASDESRINSAIREAESEVNAIFLVAVYELGKDIPSGRSIVASFGFDHNIANIVLLVIKYGVSIETVGGEMKEINKHKYEMFTYGDPHRAITNREVDEILDDDDVYDNLKGGNFAAGAVAFIRGAVSAIHNDTSGLDDESSTQILVISLSGVAVIAVVAFIVLKIESKNGVSHINSIPAQGGGKKKRSNSSHTSSYGGYRGGGYGSSGGGFGGSSGGSRGGR